MIIATSVIVNSCFAQDDVFKASWISPVKIDGNPQEWNLPLHYYDYTTKLFFAFANDGDKLYLCFQNKDEMNQYKIMQAGMKVSVGFKGKHKLTVYFPLDQKNALPVFSDNKDPLQGSNRENRRKSFLAGQTMMEVKGFRSRDGMIPVNDTTGINASINWDVNNTLTYELSIPLQELIGEGEHTGADLMKTLTLDATINALKEHLTNSGGNNAFSRRGNGQKNGEGRGGGRSRDKGMNENENNPMQSMENRAEMFEKSEFSQKFILAQPGKYN